jgi:tRNA threonylcarbamoyl adenosine modification protein YeaZ
MKILAISTSSSNASVSLLEDATVIKDLNNTNERTHSEKLMPLIDELLKKCNVKLSDINLIACDIGPGSFTGIRIGVTIAKVYAWSLKLPITIISALEAMSLSSEKEVVHVPVINARRGYVYGAIYDKDNSIIMEPKHILIDDLKKELEKLTSYEIITNDEFAEFNETSKYDPNILKIVTTFKDKVAINPHAVNPEYLKLTEAEESKNDRRSE